MFISDQYIHLFDTLRSIFENIRYSDKREIISFTDSEAEYEALTHGVGLTIHDAGVVRLSGKDVKDYLHRVSSNDINSLEEEHYKATLFLNDKGKILDRTNILNFETDFLMVAGGHLKDKLIHWIEKYIITEDVELEDISEQYFLVNIFGPQAEGFITLYYGDRTEEFESRRFVLDSIEGIDSILYKDYLNNYYFFSVLINSKSLLDFCKFIRESHSVFDVRFAGSEAFEIFRVEKGIPFYPNEINDDFNPYDLNMLTEVSFNKGCYIGQEVVARLDTYSGGRRKLSGFCFEGELPDVPVQVFNSTKENMGVITSCVHSKLLEHPIGIGPLKEKVDVENSTLYLEDGREIKIESLPFRV